MDVWTLGKVVKNMSHCDFFGRELAVGDRVAYLDTQYHELRNGEILKLNNTMATIRALDYSGPFENRMGFGRTCRKYSCIIKAV